MPNSNTCPIFFTKETIQNRYSSVANRIIAHRAFIFSMDIISLLPVFLRNLSPWYLSIETLFKEGNSSLSLLSTCNLWRAMQLGSASRPITCSSADFSQFFWRAHLRAENYSSPLAFQYQMLLKEIGSWKKCAAGTVQIFTYTNENVHLHIYTFWLVQTNGSQTHWI